MIHCRRNYQKCPDCDKPVQRASLESHILEFHTSRPCPNCGISFLPSFLASHDCPMQPKICKFCEGKYPSDQYNEHFYQCSSRTEQCPRCSKYIQIRDYDHHVAEIDCLGTRDSDSERLQQITNDVMAEFSDQPGFDFETEIVRRLAEDQDREYAEALYHKLMMERSPSHDSQLEESKSEVRAEALIEDSPGVSAPLPNLDRGVSESSWGALTDEEQLMNEIILKSLQEKKLVHWSKSLNRFRFHTVVALCVFAYPIKEQLYAFFGFISYAGLVMYGSIMRPVTATLPNKPFQEMNPKNKIGFLPPSKNVIRKTFDESNAHDLYVDSEKVMRFKMVNESDLVRTRALYAHPSRETNGVVEGEIFRNEQDKIVESMKVMMAEFGISKGIWKSIGEAFRMEDEIKTRKRREYLRSLETLT